MSLAYRAGLLWTALKIGSSTWQKRKSVKLLIGDLSVGSRTKDLTCPTAEDGHPSYRRCRPRSLADDFRFPYVAQVHHSSCWECCTPGPSASSSPAAARVGRDIETVRSTKPLSGGLLSCYPMNRENGGIRAAPHAVPCLDMPLLLLFQRRCASIKKQCWPGDPKHAQPNQDL